MIKKFERGVLHDKTKEMKTIFPQGHSLFIFHKTEQRHGKIYYISFCHARAIRK